MANSLECAIIGAGVAGAAAAYHLARAGAAATVFDQHPLLHDRGSSHGTTRLFRLAYFERPEYTPLLRRCVEKWRDLESASGERLFFQIGALLSGPENGRLISGVLKAAREHDLQIEKLTPGDFKERFPYFDPGANALAVVEPQAGFILAEQALRTHLEAARALGARLCPEEKVRGWRRRDDRLRLTTDKGEYAFDRIVVTPGAWANELLAGTGVNIRPVRKTIHWIAPGDARFTVASGFIPFAFETGAGGLFYGVPATDDEGVKLSIHSDGDAAAAPDDIEYAAGPQDDAPVLDALKTFAPGLPAAIRHRKVCIYEMSPDGDFVIDSHPDDARIVFAIGLSGHGFKFAPMIGEILADLALEGGTLSPTGFLSLKRFA
ncbi:MAG: N-methyl-L-tryptophan oxidase [Parvularculaceae bacterium]